MTLRYLTLIVTKQNLPQLIYYLLELNSFHILFQDLPDKISVEQSCTNVTERSDRKYETISPQCSDSSQH